MFTFCKLGVYNYVYNMITQQTDTCIGELCADKLAINFCDEKFQVR